MPIRGYFISSLIIDTQKTESWLQQDQRSRRIVFWRSIAVQPGETSSSAIFRIFYFVWYQRLSKSMVFGNRVISDVETEYKAPTISSYLLRTLNVTGGVFFNNIRKIFICLPTNSYDQCSFAEYRHLVYVTRIFHYMNDEYHPLLLFHFYVLKLSFVFNISLDSCSHFSGQSIL